MIRPERSSPDKGRFAAAFDGLVESAGQDARKLAGLAAAAREQGMRAQSLRIASLARSLAPDDPQVIALTARALHNGIPSWHVNILRDTARNQAYRAGIEAAVRPGDRVLDIGAGSGLLSMMAVRAGAGSVVAAEVNPAMADVATRAVAQNGMADRIAIIPKYSTDIAADELGGPVDLIVHEILSQDLLAEGVLPAIADAVPRLLAPGGRVVPRAAQLRVALASYPFAERRHLAQVEGFDLSAMNRVVRSPMPLESTDAKLVQRSDAADLFSYDFASGGPYRGGRDSIDLTVRGGPATGVVQWIRVDLCDGVVYENGPGTDPASSWACMFHPFVGGEVADGTVVRVHGAHSLNAVSIWAEPQTG